MCETKENFTQSIFHRGITIKRQRPQKGRERNGSFFFLLKQKIVCEFVHVCVCVQNILLRINNKLFERYCFTSKEMKSSLLNLNEKRKKNEGNKQFEVFEIGTGRDNALI